MPSSKSGTNTATAADSEQITDEQDNIVSLDRRGVDAERRSENADAVDSDGMDTTVIKAPRRKKQRRRHIDPTTCERDYSDPEIEFMRAMDDYKHSSGRMFPTCSEVLEVVRNLGYVRLSEEQRDELGLDDVDDEGLESADGSEESLEELEEAEL